MTNLDNLRPGQIIRYQVFGTPVTKRVMAHNINDIKRVINTRSKGQFEIVK